MTEFFYILDQILMFFSSENCKKFLINFPSHACQSRIKDSLPVGYINYPRDKTLGVGGL